VFNFEPYVDRSDNADFVASHDSLCLGVLIHCENFNKLMVFA
jgi:hypothetical protein